MKFRLFRNGLPFLLALVCMTASGQQKLPVAPGIQKLSSESVEYKLFQSFLQQKARALVQRDTSFFNRHLGPDFRYVNSTGTVQDKKAYISQRKNPDIKFIGQDVTAFELFRHGNAFYLVGEMTDDIEYKGERFSEKYRITQLFAIQGSRVMWLGGQTGSIQQPGIDNGVGLDKIALVGARIYVHPDSAVINDGTVLINGSVITAVGNKVSVNVPAGYRVINCSGKVITAGFWNNHVHFIEPHWHKGNEVPAAELEQQLSAMLGRYGFVYAFDLAALDPSIVDNIRMRINSGEVNGPTIFSVRQPFVPVNGNPGYIEPLQLTQVGTTAEAMSFVHEQVRNGAHGIKLWTASPTGKRVVVMPDSIVKAAVNAAHAMRRPVFAHPTSLDGVRNAYKNGVDVIVHVAAEGEAEELENVINGIIKSGTALIPTLYLFEWELMRDGVKGDVSSHPLMQTALLQARAFAKQNGTMLFGTDVGYVTNYDVSREYYWLQKAGLSFRQVLSSLTTAPASRLGYGLKGTVAKGEPADIVVLNGDPERNITALAEVEMTIHKGRVIYQKR